MAFTDGQVLTAADLNNALAQFVATTSLSPTANALLSSVSAAAARSAIGISTVGGTGKFADLTNKPTTIGGYGITDAYTKTQTDGKFVAFTGDSGSGGAIGQVPAPAAGDAAAGKVLTAAGTWSANIDAIPRQAVSPRQYGAIGNGIADDTAAVQAALNAVRSSYAPGLGLCKSYFDGEGLTYFVTSTLDFTNAGFARGGYITNATFYASFTVPSPLGNNAVLDFTGTNLWFLDRINIEGAKTNSPDYGIVFTRINGGGEAGRGHIGYLTCHGYFSKACILNYCSEVFSADYLMLNNSYPSLSATCLAIFGSSSLAQKYFTNAWASGVPGITAITGDMSCSNHRIGFIDARMGTPWGPVTMHSISNATSGVVTVASGDMTTMLAAGFGNGSTVYFTGIAGMTQLNGQVATVSSVNSPANTFTININTSAYSAYTTDSSTVVPQTAPAIIIGNVHHTTIRGYIRVTGNAGLLIDPTAVADGTRAIEFDGRVENGPPVDIYIAGNGSTNYVRGLKVMLDISAAFVGQIMTTGVTTGGAVVLQDAEIHCITVARTPTGGFFGDPQNIATQTVRAYVPTASLMQSSSLFNAASVNDVQWHAGDFDYSFAQSTLAPEIHSTNGGFAINLNANKRRHVCNAAYTVTRNVTLGTNFTQDGGVFRVEHRGTGSNLSVGPGLITLSPGQWCDMVWQDATTSWVVSANG